MVQFIYIVSLVGGKILPNHKGINRIPYKSKSKRRLFPDIYQIITLINIVKFKVVNAYGVALFNAHFFKLVDYAAGLQSSLEVLQT